MFSTPANPVALTLHNGSRAFFVTAQALIASFEMMFSKEPDKPVSMQQLFSTMHQKAHPFMDRDAEMDRVVPALAAPLAVSVAAPADVSVEEPVTEVATAPAAAEEPAPAEEPSTEGDASPGEPPGEDDFDKLAQPESEID